MPMRTRWLYGIVRLSKHVSSCLSALLSCRFCVGFMVLHRRNQNDNVSPWLWGADMTTLKAAAVWILVFWGMSFAALAFDLKANKEDVRKALELYTSCSKNCAVELAEKLGNESIDQILETVGYTAAAKSDTSKKVKVLAFYAFLRSAYSRGKSVVKTHAVCAQSCDQLNDAIVTLGRAGLLGPMVRGDKLDEAALSRPEIWEAYVKFVNPIQLPAEHRSEEWWKFIRSLS